MNTTGFKDHFSSQAIIYSKYRPGYPDELFKYLASLAPARTLAWDCATGSGQAAMGLVKHFDKVIATDASEKQISSAIPHEKIDYRVAPAEHAPIADSAVDLIVVAQALHWFETALFFAEAKRVLKDRGVIAVWSYNLLEISSKVDAIIDDFYENTLGEYWPPERRLIESEYKDIAFPFEKIAAPVFAMSTLWSLDHLVGYLGTWSAVQKYKEITGRDPVESIISELRRAWGKSSRKRKVEWPLALRAGINVLKAGDQ